MTEPARLPAWGEEKIGAPKEFSNVTSLGHFHRAFTNRGNSQAFVILIIGGILAAVGGVMALVAQNAIAFVPFGSFGAIFLGIGLLLARRPGNVAKLAASYQDGFAVLTGSKVSLWGWDEITSVITKNKYLGSTRNRGNIEDQRCEVLKNSGETVGVWNMELADAPVLIEAIKAHVEKRLLPTLQTSYDSGETLTFGPIKVSRHVIETDGHRLDWKEIRNVIVRDGKVIVTPKEGKPFDVRVRVIPNVDLFLQLIGVKYARLELAYIF